MSYADERIIFDADSHLMELPDYLREFADPDIRDRLPKLGETATAIFDAKNYAGQFHTNYPDLKDRTIMGMDGASGQTIIIDFSKAKIVVINSIHLDYNWKKLAISKL